MPLNKNRPGRPMTFLIQFGGGGAVIGLFLIIYGFPISGFVRTGAALLVGGFLLMVGLIAWESRSDGAVKNEKNQG